MGGETIENVLGRIQICFGILIVSLDSSVCLKKKIMYFIKVGILKKIYSKYYQKTVNCAPSSGRVMNEF